LEHKIVPYFFLSSTSLSFYCSQFFDTDIDRVKYANIQFIFRKLLVADYIQKCESEMEKIQSKIEHLSEQEARWQKLENYIRRSFQLQHNCLDELAEW
jgi:hypothetical protein